MSEQPPVQPKIETITRTKTPWWAYAIVLALVGLVALIVSRPTDHEATAEERQADAKRACQEEFIPSRLKAPATAQFTDVAVTSSASTYTVTGSVDSQNGFGALIRSTFICTMHSADDRWVLDAAAVG